MNRIKVAIIGCGRISYKHVEALVNNKEEAVLTAVCDIINENAQVKKRDYINKMSQNTLL